MRRECQEVAVQSLHIHGQMRHSLCTVDTDRYILCMRQPDDILHGLDDTEHVAHIRHADQTRALIEQRSIGFYI